MGLESASRCPECGHAFLGMRVGRDPQAATRDAAASLAIGIVCVPLVILPCVDLLLPFVAFGFGTLSLYSSARTRAIIAWPTAIAIAGIALAAIALGMKLFVLFGVAFLLNG